MSVPQVPQISDCINSHLVPVDVTCGFKNVLIVKIFSPLKLGKLYFYSNFLKHKDHCCPVVSNIFVQCRMCAHTRLFVSEIGENLVK